MNYNTPDTGDTPDVVPRKPWLAALASLVLPVFGQLYNGEVNRAIWLFLAFALLFIPGLGWVALYLPDGWLLPTLLLSWFSIVALWIYCIGQAWSKARVNALHRVRTWQISGVYALVFLLCDFVLLPLLTIYVREHQVEPFRIPSSSMEPSVMRGDFIFADKRYNCPGCRQGVHRGDIAIFAYPNDRSVRYIKRVIALPGDQVEYRNRQVSVNGQPLQVLREGDTALVHHEQIDGRTWRVSHVDEEPLRPETAKPPFNRAAIKPVTELSLRVPDGQVFVMGDNRETSVDSRSFGTVPLQDILGHARQVWFSFDQGKIRWERLGTVLQ